MTRDLAGDFGKNAKFITHLENFVPEFYENVGQHLSVWKPKPPKLISETEAAAAPVETTAQPQTSATHEYYRNVAQSLSVEAIFSTDRQEEAELPTYLNRVADNTTAKTETDPEPL